MKFYKLVIYDIKQGFYYNRKKYVLTMFVVLFTVPWLLSSLKFGYDNKIIGARMTFCDVVLYFLRGMKVYIPQGEKYILPVIWLLIQTMIAYIVGYYPKEDLYGFGQQIFLRVSKKTYWWFSKCIWCVLSVTFVYLIIGFVSIIVYICVEGEKFGSCTPELIAYLYGLDVNQKAIGEMIMPLFVMPWMVSLTVSLLQMMMCFFVSSAISYLLVISIMAVSSYITSPLLIGNYSMVLRCREFVAGGMDTNVGVAFCCFIGVCSIVVGTLHIRKFEVLKG